MRILVVSDYAEPGLWDNYNSQKTIGTDLIISCGDLQPDYLEFLATMVNCPLVYVCGNHDDDFKNSPPMIGENIDGKVYDFKGIKIFGLGGSYRYRDGINMYSEKEMKRRIIHSKLNLNLKDGIDILVTHAPCKGYGDLEDLAHQGFNCFNNILNIYKPKYMVHGHIHKEYGKFQREIIHPSGTTIINAWGHTFIEI